MSRPRSDPSARDGRFQDAMARGLREFSGRVLLLLSGNDLTAKEFVHYTSGDRLWRGLLHDSKVTCHEMPEADHTFSRRAWRDEAEAQTIAWLNRLFGSAAATATQH